MPIHTVLRYTFTSLYVHSSSLQYPVFLSLILSKWYQSLPSVSFQSVFLSCISLLLACLLPCQSIISSHSLAYVISNTQSLPPSLQYLHPSSTVSCYWSINQPIVQPHWHPKDGKAVYIPTSPTSYTHTHNTYSILKLLKSLSGQHIFKDVFWSKEVQYKKEYLHRKTAFSTVQTMTSHVQYHNITKSSTKCSPFFHLTAHKSGGELEKDL